MPKNGVHIYNEEKAIKGGAFSSSQGGYVKGWQKREINTRFLNLENEILSDIYLNTEKKGRKINLKPKRLPVGRKVAEKQEKLEEHLK